MEYHNSRYEICQSLKYYDNYILLLYYMVICNTPIGRYDPDFVSVINAHYFSCSKEARLHCRPASPILASAITRRQPATRRHQACLTNPPRIPIILSGRSAVAPSTAASTNRVSMLPRATRRSRQRRAVIRRALRRTRTWA